MYGVTLREYGDESKLKLEEGLTVPEPKSNQVLVKVSASSVNPLRSDEERRLWEVDF